MINTNLPPILHRVSKLWLIIHQIFASERECLTLSLSLGVIPCQYRHINNVLLKLHCLAYISAAESSRVSSPTITQSAQKATEFGEIEQPLGLLRRSRSFKVTEFHTNRKLICDFLLVINSNLIISCILHRDITFETSKIAIFGFPSCV